MKRWTYKQITEAAERELSVAEAFAAKYGESRKAAADWAWGVFGMWDRVTIGWQEPGEAARMKMRVEAILHAGPPVKGDAA